MYHVACYTFCIAHHENCAACEKIKTVSIGVLAQQYAKNMNASVYLTLENMIETGYDVTYGLLPYEQNNKCCFLTDVLLIIFKLQY